MLGTAAHQFVAAGRRTRTGRILLSPSAVAVLGFVLAACAGTLLFLLPGSTRAPGISGVDAFFLSMSAVCVTGLSSVPNLSDVLTEQGWWILFGLLQLGGVGVVFMGALTLAIFGARLPVRHAQALREGFAHRKGGMGRLVLRVGVLTIAAEAAGALILRQRLGDSPTAWRDAIFHATSAFCNAGFSTFGRGLEERAHDPAFLATIMALIVLGGAGFTTLSETAKAFFLRRRLPLHARIVWRTSSLLLFLGAAAFFFLERDGVLAGFEGGEAGLGSLFHSVSARTAGFNTVAVDMLRPATLLMMIVLMTIGGSPGSTAGGVKTVTAAVALAALRAGATGRRSVTIGKRSIAPEQVQRAMLIVMIHLATLIVVVVGLTFAMEGLADKGVGFLDVAFESASALGTVGLSTGLTPLLPAGGKLLLASAMLIGRVGPLTIMLAVVPPPRPEAIRYPEERVFLG